MNESVQSASSLPVIAVVTEAMLSRPAWHVAHTASSAPVVALKSAGVFVVVPFAAGKRTDATVRIVLKFAASAVTGAWQVVHCMPVTGVAVTVARVLSLR